LKGNIKILQGIKLQKENQIGMLEADVSTTRREYQEIKSKCHMLEKDVLQLKMEIKNFEKQLDDIEEEKLKNVTCNNEIVENVAENDLEDDPDLTCIQGSQLSILEHNPFNLQIDELKEQILLKDSEIDRYKKSTRRLEELLEKTQDQKLTHEYESMSLKEKLDNVKSENSETILRLENSLSEQGGKIMLMNLKIKKIEDSCVEKDGVIDRLTKENEKFEIKYDILEDFRNQIFCTVKEYNVKMSSDSPCAEKDIADKSVLRALEVRQEFGSPSKPLAVEESSRNQSIEKRSLQQSNDIHIHKGDFLAKDSFRATVKDSIAKENDENQSSLSQTSY